MQTKPGFHTDRTVAEYVVPNIFSVVRGVLTCKIVNFIIQSTNLKICVEIGGRYYMVSRITPQPQNKIRVSLTGNNSMVVDWYTKFTFYLAGDLGEFDKGFKDGKVFTIDTE